MSAVPRPVNPPQALHDRAADDLRYIRSTMERAATFTAVSGRGYVLLGLTALVAAVLARLTATTNAWIAVWLAELVGAAVIAILTTAQKARRLGTPLVGGAGRKLLLGFAPVMTAGGAISVALVRADAAALLPGTWLAVYGAAVVAGGVFSIRLVPALGAAFLALGVATLLLPVLPGDAMLALGFGGLHIVWGILIARRHGG
jgi:hypothetical protein